MTLNELMSHVMKVMLNAVVLIATGKYLHDGPDESTNL